MTAAILAVALQLTFSAVGDDGLIGTASRYEVQADTDSTFAAPVLHATPAPLASGAQMFATVNAPLGVTYWRVVAIDDAGLRSTSNIYRHFASAPDTTRPGAPVVTLERTEP